MSTKIKALVCLFLLGFLVGACGRKFRAIDENRAIEARAIRLANLHFSSLFDSGSEYQDHVTLKNELLAMEFHADSQSSRMGVRVRESNCVVEEAGVVQYSNDMVLQSVKETAIAIPGQQNYGFYAVCIPTATRNNQSQCVHFLIAISKQYAPGQVGAALAVVGLDRQTGRWRNLDMSGDFLYSVNLRTLGEVDASFACRSVDTQNIPGQDDLTTDPATGLPTTNDPNTNNGQTPPFFPEDNTQTPAFDSPTSEDSLFPDVDIPDGSVNPLGPVIPIGDDDDFWFN